MNVQKLVRVLTLVCAFGFLGNTKTEAQVYGPYAWWHYQLPQGGRNYFIWLTAQSVPNSTYGGQCKEWVQNVVWRASYGTVWLPQNNPYCDWMWYWSNDVEIVAEDRWDGVPMYSGQIIQAQVRYSHWPYTSPHTMIVDWANANYISVIECNYGAGNSLRVSRRTVTWAQFRANTIHYTLYNVR